MIDSVHLINFQKWIDKRIEFGPGVNVIVGESRRGKSSIFRALLFTLLNESKKMNFVNWDAKFAEVIVQINESVVTRRKNMTGTKNEYEIDELPLKAFGLDVPAEVQNITRIDEINVERQHDDYFLISLKPGPLGSYFNQLVGLESIDEAFAKSSSLQSETTAKLKAKKEQLIEIDEQRNQLSYLEAGSAAFSQLTTLKEDAAVITGRRDSIADKIAEIKEIEEAFDFNVEELLRQAGKLKSESNEVESKSEEITGLKKLIEQYPADINLGNIEELIATAMKLKEEEKRLDFIDDRIKEFNRLQDENYNIEMELTASLEELFKLSPKCPFCGGKWNEN
jgi:DNA repair exonuclease SbcCD ATPase subunit